MLSPAFTRILAVTLLASLLPGVRADCWIDEYVYPVAIPQHPLSAQLDLFLSFPPPPTTTLATAMKPVTD
jgi:hypothetical protein